MTMDQPTRDIVETIGETIGSELGLLIKLARHERSTTQDVIDAIDQLPAEDIRPLLFGAVLVLAQRGVFE